jgi:hypothetical protein
MRTALGAKVETGLHLYAASPQTDTHKQNLKY